VAEARLSCMRFPACSSTSHWYQRDYASSVVGSDLRGRIFWLGYIHQICARDSGVLIVPPSPPGWETPRHSIRIRLQQLGE